MTTTKTVPCPRDDCDGDVSVTMEYEPAERNYGADADGNRGIYVSGYWTADVADKCSLGHTLTADETTEIEEEETQGMSSPDDDYDDVGPYDTNEEYLDR